MTATYCSAAITIMCIPTIFVSQVACFVARYCLQSILNSTCIWATCHPATAGQYLQCRLGMLVSIQYADSQQL